MIIDLQIDLGFECLLLLIKEYKKDQEAKSRF